MPENQDKQIEISIENANVIDAFEGVILHPSLDFKDGVAIVSFRYLNKSMSEQRISLISMDGNVLIVTQESFTRKEKVYHIEKKYVAPLALIDDRWSITAAQSFLEDRMKVVPSPDVMVSRGVEQISSEIKRFIKFEKPIDYEILAAWIIGTYFHRLFNAYPFLHLKAPKGSGKSQCLNLLSQLCFNPVKARPTLAALADTVDALRGTYLIDQADGLNRKGNEDLLDILADSYKRAGGKRRVVNFDKKRGREVLEMETYCPKAFASIKELPEDLRDRCFVLNLLRSNTNFPDPHDPTFDWLKLRDRLYRLLLNEHGLIDAIYVTKRLTYRDSSEITGRTLELWLPMEVILEAFGARDKVEEAKGRFLSQYGFSEYEPDDLDVGVVQVLYEKLQEITELVLSPKEIADTVDQELFRAGSSPKQRAVAVGWVIKRFNLASEKKSRSKDGMRYLFLKDKVEQVILSYFESAIDITPHTQDQKGSQDESQESVQDVGAEDAPF